jgi:Fe-Mn family superoxide dismutase
MQKTKLTLAPLPYSRDALEPILSKVSVDIHFGTLTKNYIQKFNDTGDSFQRAGYLLHELWWANLRAPSTGNKPTGKVCDLLCEKFGDFPTFQEVFTEAATTIKGNGWCAVLDDGKIIQIPNHKLHSGIILLVDMWEHSYFLDYKTDKRGYVKNIWKIVDWDAVNQRM